VLILDTRGIPEDVLQKEIEAARKEEELSFRGQLEVDITLVHFEIFYCTKRRMPRRSRVAELVQV
jgi:hypothetical protein